MNRPRHAAPWFAAVFLTAASDAAIDFNRDIRPILNKECISCHGGVKRAGELSLQFREDALKEGESGVPGIVPDHPEKSEMYIRLLAEDSTERMPKKAAALKPAQIAKIKEWIAEGAPWADHWAYTPLRKPSVPAVAGVAPIDAFVQQRLRAENLSPAAEAPRAAILRRLSFDLIGLPPSILEVEAFENDGSPNAYEKQVDRLLASPHFGERWAALWMDLARYADSKGFATDPSRPMWPYRDWLVNAFNVDLPFDEFTIKQLAGDLLPGATEEDRIATAMQRLTSTNDEGGTDDEEFRTSAVLDRVTTTWETWLGTSIGCAQCHDHPYDPFRQKEFYQSVAFFNNTADADRADDAPTLDIYRTPGDRAKIAELNAQVSGLEKRRDALKQLKSDSGENWLALKPTRVTAGKGLTAAVEKTAVRLTGSAPPTDTTTVVAASPVGKIGSLRIDTLPQPGRPNQGAGLSTSGNFVLTGIEVAVLLPEGGQKRLEFVSAEADFQQTGYSIAHVLRNPDPDSNGWAVAPQFGVPHYGIFRAKEAIEVPAGAQLQVKLRHQHTRKGRYPGASLGSFKLSAVPGFAPNPRIAELAETEKALAEATKHRAEFLKTVTRLPVMADLAGSESRKTHMFIRGNWLTKGDEVQPGTPASLPSMPEGAPRNRLGLAQWIVAKENPLTARVAVNRIWEQLFGIGLVETAEDFGTKGETPTHADLLDWLAASYRDDFRWSTKRLIREIVLSAAYRRDSRAAPAQVARDPRNVLLARGPRVRLAAEMVRDSALAVSGLLNPALGGPSVMPPLPEGVIPLSPYNRETWVTSPGGDRYRRAIYTLWKRNNPYPSLVLFDSAERAICTSRRLRTNTPLQALVTFNDPVYVEAARALARRMRAEAGDGVEAALAHGWRLVTLEKPSSTGIQKLAALYRDSLAQFQKDLPAAQKFAGTPEAAAMTNVASVLLNLDQVITK